jgi:uncharacterized protein YceK
MNLKLIMASLVVTLWGSLSGCASLSQQTTPEDMSIRPAYSNASMSYRQDSQYVGYGPRSNSVYFSHDGAIGYGGVNVYSYRGL